MDAKHAVSRGRPFQFSTRTLLLAISFLSITAAASALVLNRLLTNPYDKGIAASAVVVLSPMWVPVAFLIYAAGRRAITPSMLFAFAVIEAADVGILIWMSR